MVQQKAYHRPVEVLMDVEAEVEMFAAMALIEGTKRYKELERSDNEVL